MLAKVFKAPTMCLATSILNAKEQGWARYARLQKCVI